MRARLTPPQRSLLAIVAEGFLSRLSFGFITLGLPLYAHRLGLPLNEIGLLISLDVAVALALRPLAGRAADRFGLKRTFGLAILLRSVVALGLCLAGSPWQLYLLRSGMGVAQALRDPPLTALIAEHGGKRAVASAFAWYQTAKAVAGPLGAALAGLLLTLSGGDFPFVFGVAFGLSVLPVYVVTRYVGNAQGRSEHDAAVPPTPRARIASATGGPNRPRFLIPAFIGLGFLISGTAQMLRGVLPVLATTYAGLSEAQTGLIYAISSGVVLVSGPALGWLSDNVSQKLVLSTRSVANTVSSLSYLVLPGLLGFGLGKVLDDVGKSAFRLAWGTLMADVSESDRERRGQTISLMAMGEDAGEVAGPILAGLLWSTWGIAALLGVRVVLAIGTELYATLLVRSLRRRQAQTANAPLPGASRLVFKGAKHVGHW